jgi:hypothetical protein
MIGAKKVNGKDEPLASRLLQQWLDFGPEPGAALLVIRNPPQHLRESKYVLEVLRYHRRVYLTEEQARFTGGSKKWAGVIPRLQGKSGFTPWDGKSDLDLNYQSLVDIPISVQLFGSDGDKDLLYALHDFQLKSQVTVAGSPAPDGKLTITFKKFEAQAIDRYDWDPTKHITVPNPDYKSAAADAVAPDSEKIDVYHSNARRVEAAGLAKPYDLNTVFWDVTDASVTAQGTIDPGKSI